MFKSTIYFNILIKGVGDTRQSDIGCFLMLFKIIVQNHIEIFLNKFNIFYSMNFYVSFL